MILVGCKWSLDHWLLPAGGSPLMPGACWPPAACTAGQLLPMAAHLPGRGAARVRRAYSVWCPSCSPCPEACPVRFATGLGCLTLDGRGSHASVACWGLLTCVPRPAD